MLQMWTLLGVGIVERVGDIYKVNWVLFYLKKKALQEDATENSQTTRLRLSAVVKPVEIVGRSPLGIPV